MKIIFYVTSNYQSTTIASNSDENGCVAIFISECD